MKNKNYPKMMALFALILVTATSLWFASPAIFCYAEGGYEVVSGGGGGGLPVGYTFLGTNVDSNGVLTIDTTAESLDNICQLTLKKGTTALKMPGVRLTSILITKTQTTPTPPLNAQIIGSVYDLGPSGAIFDPPITATLTYNPSNLPAGVVKEDLVIAYRNGTNWINLEGPFTVDAAKNTISAPLSHFTEFAIIAFTSPAAFTTSSLTISPTEISTGQDITIDATVTNTGDLAGSYEVVLKIANEMIATKEITLAGHASQKVTFATKANYAAGNYAISIGGLSGTLTIKAPIAPTPTPTPPAPTPTPTPPAPAPTPTPPAPTPTPTPTPTSAPTQPVTPVNWWLIGGIIAIVVIIAVVAWLLITRRRYA